METTAITEMIDVLSFEAAQLWDFMARLGHDGWSRPSACTGWTVGDVLAHVTQGASAWCATITRAVAGDAHPPPGEQGLRPCTPHRVKLSQHNGLLRSPGTPEPVAVAPERRGAAGAAEGAPEELGTAVVPRPPAQHPRTPSYGRLQGPTLVACIRPLLTPVCTPLPDIPRHLVHPPGAAPLGIVPHPADPLLPPIPPMPTPAACLPVIAPGIYPAIHPTRSLLPLQLARQP
jgi:Mycothiol maleylpyruvate isomerase N-terminal domain